MDVNIEFKNIREYCSYTIWVHMQVLTREDFHLTESEHNFLTSLMVVRLKGHKLTSVNISKIFEKKKGMEGLEIIRLLTILKSKRWLRMDDDGTYELPPKLRGAEMKLELNYKYDGQV